jgi:hypothetical protein
MTQTGFGFIDEDQVGQAREKENEGNDECCAKFHATKLARFLAARFIDTNTCTLYTQIPPYPNLLHFGVNPTHKQLDNRNCHKH